MAEKRKIWRVKDTQGTLEQVFPQTTAEQVVVDATTAGITSTDVQSALKEVADIAKTGGVTGVKGSAETEYRKGDVNITKANIGLGNVDNTSDANKPVSTAQQTALDAKVDKTTTVNGHALSGNVTVSKSDVGLGNVTNDAQVKRSEMGVASGVATLDATGKVPTAQLPSYVDDVLEFANRAGFPTSGEAGKIYVAKDTNKTYRWSGTAYVVISETLALGETSSTAYAGDKGKANADAISALQTTVGNLGDTYQTKTDNGLSTTDKTVVGAINGIKGRVDKIEDGTTKVKKAETADKLATAINVSVTGAVTGTSADSDLSGNISIPTTLADDAVVTAKIKDLNVTEGKLAANAVTTDKIKDSNVTSGKIADGAITMGKLATNLGATGSFSAVTVQKGIVTAGGTSIEFGASGQTAPSKKLMVDGLFFELQ